MLIKIYVIYLWQLYYVYITKQNNRNECGICVINTLFRKYYRHDIKTELLRKANITNEGLSIFDLELLATKYNIVFETYNCIFAELKSIKKLVVVMVKTEYGNHFTLIKMNKQHVQCYDSIKGNYILTFKEFEDIFNNVVMIPYKSSKQNLFISHEKIKLNIITFKNICMMISLDLIITCMIMIGGYYISIVLNNIIESESIQNFMLITYFFIAVYVTQHITTYVKNIVMGWNYYHINLQLTNNFLLMLQIKKREFINKIDVTNIYNIEECIDTLSRYFSYDCVSVLSSIIQIVAISIYLLIVHYLLFIAIFIAFMFMMLYTFFYYDYYKKNVAKFLNKNDSHIVIDRYVKGVMVTNNGDSINNTILNIKNCFHNNIQIKNINNRFSIINQFIVIFISRILTICILTISIINLILHNNNYMVINIIVLLTMSEIVTNNMSYIIKFFVLHANAMQMKSVYCEILEVGNYDKCDVDIKISSIKSIEIVFNNKSYKLTNGIHIKNLKRIFYIKHILLKQQNRDDVKMYINGYNIDDINQTEINNHFLLVPSSNYILDKGNMLTKYYQNPLILNFIKQYKYKINFHSTKLKDIQIINIFYALLTKDTIVYFQNCFKYIPRNMLMYIYRNILPEIRKNNFVIYDC